MKKIKLNNKPQETLEPTNSHTNHSSKDYNGIRNNNLSESRNIPIDEYLINRSLQIPYFQDRKSVV